MIEEDKRMQSKLKQELSDVQFTEAMKQQVLRKAKPSLWEREVQLPQSAALAGGLIVLAAVVIWLLPLTELPRNPSSGHAAISSTAQYVIIEGGVFHREALMNGGKP